MDDVFTNDDYNLDWIINHVFLPPKLPQKSDHDVENGNTSLLQLILKAARNFHYRLSWEPDFRISGYISRFNTVYTMLEAMAELENPTSVPVDQFRKALRQLRPGGSLAFLITAQNAGLLIQHHGLAVHFSSFEVSPKSADVLGCKGKLLCSYPGPALAVLPEFLRNDKFTTELGDFLDRAKRDMIPIAQGKGSKAGIIISSERESSHPMFITEMLTGILRAFGEPAEVERIQKRIADDVIWAHGSAIPWRRSPLWVVIRVALQLCLRDSSSSDPDHLYKTFMVFFMTRILQLSRTSNSDILSVMSTKISRRVSKMSLVLPKFVSYLVQRVCEDTHCIIETRWKEERDIHTRALYWNPRELNFKGDTALSMTSTDKYLSRTLQHSKASLEKSRFTPRELPRIQHLLMMFPPSLDALKDPATVDTALVDFERWVQDMLPRLSGNQLDEDTAIRLSARIDEYITTASSKYANSPEHLSIMILSSLELWILLDTYVCDCYPLVKDYYPIFNPSAFESLLLKTSSQRNRLRSVEVYLMMRRSTAKYFLPEVFGDIITKNSFSVRYFDQEPDLEVLRESIINRAEQQRKEKEQEFKSMLVKHEELVYAAQNKEHQWFTHWEYGYTRHDRYCLKCKLVKEADNMRIEIHEWPLPEDDIKSKAIVFELRCPVTYAIWRDATFKLIRDLGHSAEPKGNFLTVREKLNDYHGLRGDFQKCHESYNQRIQLYSATKSWMKTHFKKIRYTTHVEELFVPHPLTYGLYHIDKKEWLEGRKPADINAVCTFSLPAPYKCLQYTMHSTNHSSNEILSKQPQEDNEISAHEYTAFGTIRSGSRLQWHNILRELRCRSLNFSHEATGLLLTQCAWQVGPYDTFVSGRLYHEDLDTANFRNNLLADLEQFLDDIHNNWQEAATLNALIILCHRVLSSYRTGTNFVFYRDFDARCTKFLARAATISLKWARSLSEKVSSCRSEEVDELQIRIVMLAAICRSTFDLDGQHPTFFDADSLNVYIEAAILIDRNSSAPSISRASTSLTRQTRALLTRDKRLALRLEHHARKAAIMYGIDLSKVWSAYSPGTPWQSLLQPNDCWMVTEMPATKDMVSQEVHLNLLTGKLLVQGLPIGRMDIKYTSHNLYKELFEHQVLEVFPASMLGMDYQTEREISGFQIGFALRDGELIIRTKRQKDNVIHQLIPREAMRDDFPEHIIRDHLHWHNISTGDIEMRPFDDPWSFNPKTGYRITEVEAARRLFLGHNDHVGNQYLIDVRSATSEMITKILGSLEYKKHIDVFWNEHLGFTAHLPRMKIDFGLRRGELYWRQFPNMIVDSNQDIGTLVGLENRLVVKESNSRNPIRQIIIPHGKVTFKPRQTHITVDIDTKNKPHVRYSTYAVDTILGRLVGNGSLASHLYLCYLHAVTSYCLPDPLTGKTGTEEAIQGLQTGQASSFHTLDTRGEEAELFKCIAALTPQRSYYPPNMKIMQEVIWSKLISPLAQHDAFHSIVQQISDHASRFHIFYPEIYKSAETAKFYSPLTEVHLLERAHIRHSAFRSQQFENIPLTDKIDVVYCGRDVVDCSDVEARVHHLTRLALAPTPTYRVCSKLIKTFNSWKSFSGCKEDIPHIGYDGLWLNKEMRDAWCALYSTLTAKGSIHSIYSVIFMLSTFVFRDDLTMEFIQTLLAIATDQRFRFISLPKYPEYDLSEGSAPDTDVLTRVIKECGPMYTDSEAEDTDDRLYGLAKQFNMKIKLDAKREKLVMKQARTLAIALMKQWPCEDLMIPVGDFSPIDTDEAFVRVAPFFRNAYRNMRFQEYIMDVQDVLDTINTNETFPLCLYRFKLPTDREPTLRKPLTSLQILFETRPPPLQSSGPQIRPPDNLGKAIATLEGEPASDELLSLLKTFRSNRKKGFRSTYADGLESSIKALQNEHLIPPNVGGWSKEVLAMFRDEYKQYIDNVASMICDSLGPRTAEEKLCFDSGLWPRLPTLILLQQLASGNTKIVLTLEWKKFLVQFALSITELQRADRLLRAWATPDFHRESENEGHRNWDPMLRTDWLLLEIESNVLIRPVQADIAATMISPPESYNTVVQLLMGEGKTSVVTPIVTAATADGEQLVRVVVLKPLAGQMYQTLVQKLGGLLNRRIFFMPFSRSIKMGLKEANVVRELLQECQRTGGVLLAHPEHILSFKLLGLEWLYNASSRRGKMKLKEVKDSHNAEDATDKAFTVEENYAEVAGILIQCQAWIEETSRDILDESDEILNVRHELIYSIGTSSPLQNGPDRWVIVMEIFNVIQEHLAKGKFSPEDFEIAKTENPCQFPHFRILQTRAGGPFLKAIAKKIVNNGLPTINFRFLNTCKRDQAEKFITDPNMPRIEGEDFLKACGNFDGFSTAMLYLLRGLFAHNIIFFILRDKRWKVDYGLDLKRTGLAVPYRAKDSPAGRAEFSHPDVAITTTITSYYYGGLNPAQLKLCFKRLYHSDNPAMLYEGWTKGILDLDRSLWTMSGINLDDVNQWNYIEEKFQYNKAVIDFYLCEFVFPRKAKEFKDKLSTSGWDIAEVKKNPTTGYSGTNDNQYILPVSITQLNREAQLSTNARVLKYLLQKENTYLPVEVEYTGRLGFNKILRLIEKAEETYGKPVRVLLDVGAQVLDYSNWQVAWSWMQSLPEKKVEAAVYFDEADILTVVSRDGMQEPLLVSAYAQKLDACVIYLDEAHTRGTDLKLPYGMRAAVALGPGLTKDRLVQACMRMRKLGQGHSIVFIAPLEVQRKLQRQAEKEKRTEIQSRDVILWCMEQSCMIHRKLIPVWAKQGISYQNRVVVWNKLQKSTIKKFPEAILEQEARTLEEHYGFNRANTNDLFGFSPARQFRCEQFKRIEQICNGVQVTSFRGAPMLEEQEQEQERELYHEIEVQRSTQRGPHVTPASHNFDPSLRSLVCTGTLNVTNKNYLPAFTTLFNTSAKACDVPGWNPRLLVTRDFATVITGIRNKLDHFLRPVQWILSSRTDPSFLLILSPFEVNCLLPEIRRSQIVTLHMYSPRTTKDAPTFEDLTYCAIPPLPRPIHHTHDISLIDQLNLFAGQLYFTNKKAYDRVCGFLALCLREVDPRLVDAIGSDGWVASREVRKELGMIGRCPFGQSMVLGLRELMAVRRKGHGYLATHLGQVLHGRPVEEWGWGER